MPTGHTTPPQLERPDPSPEPPIELPADGTAPLRGPHAEDPPWPTAHEHKEASRVLADLTADERKLVPILPPGTRLMAGSTYLDLLDPTRREFPGDDAVVGDAQLVVPKQQVPYEVWNKLRGRSR